VLQETLWPDPQIETYAQTEERWAAEHRTPEQTEMDLVRDKVAGQPTGDRHEFLIGYIAEEIMVPFHPIALERVVLAAVQGREAP